MRSEEREEVAQRALGHVEADQAEVIVYDSDESLTRFTHNAIHQNVAAADRTVRIRAVLDHRVGIAETNDLADGALQAAAHRAVAIAKVAPSDEAFPGLPRSLRVSAPAGAYIEATAEATPDVRAKLAAEIFAVAERERLWAAGYVSTTRHGITIANSLGTVASFDGTDGAVNVKQNAADSSGYAEHYSTDVDALAASAAGRRAADKALQSCAPVPVEPGPWTVILEPAALGELISYLADHFSAQAYDEGSSFVSDGLDRSYTGENVTLSDDYAHPLAPGMPFDFEGVPTERLALVERGVARRIVTDSYWAAKLRRENTGHALPAPHAQGPLPTHLVLAGGTKSLDQLIAETDRGLLVSRFWYIRPVDRRETIVTGMTRDGTFLIENGKLVHGVRNMRFNQSILSALNDAEFSSEQAHTTGLGYSMVVPAARTSVFRFTSATEF